MILIEPEDVSDIWGDKQIELKVFISHRDGDRGGVIQLAHQLDTLNVSTFVAHENIKPTEIWRDKILKSLGTMDIFIAYLTSNFYGGIYTNQEVGFALGKGVPILYYSADETDPEGFGSIEQAIKDKKNKGKEEQLIKLISDKGKKASIFEKYQERQQVITNFCNKDNYGNCHNYDAVTERFNEMITKISIFSDTEIEKIVQGITHEDNKPWNQFVTLFNPTYNGDSLKKLLLGHKEKRYKICSEHKSECCIYDTKKGEHLKT